MYCDYGLKTEKPNEIFTNDKLAQILILLD